MKRQGDVVSVLIVDDESRARKLMKARLTEVEGYELAGEASTGAEAIELIAGLSPDLVLLDIQMPRGTGIEVFEQIGLERMPATIFVTAYSEFAVRAFELHAVDYLLKPFTRERFQEALERALRRVRMSAPESTGGGLRQFLDYFSKAQFAPGPPSESGKHYLQRVVVTSTEPWRSIAVEAIEWMRAEDHFVRLYSQGQSYLLAGKISDYEQQLDPASFLRIHRCVIVNLGAVKKTGRSALGTPELVLSDGTRLRISRSRRNDLRVALLRRSADKPRT